ncbi:clpB protein [Klebsiella michiganensis]|uniref:ClpB protein n=1 Tax=Klebsiella michiganensis TaxID=1134687 RepID=A0A7H4N0F1_9ENTR|nr:clpB protein [Klebsiella michiganensis]
MENPAILLRRLNPYCARAMEGAATLCQTRAHAEILPEHWLLKLLEQGEGDLTVLARRYEWDMDAIWQDLLTFMDKLPPFGARPPAAFRRYSDSDAGGMAERFAGRGGAYP